MDPRVYLAFRFHTNFYHSYRGDTPDEQGFGKDIRIIRHIIRVLDRFNAQGVPVRGTWDIENAFSLGDIMPRHCPDLIRALQRRVALGLDEIEAMSYNNGLISAHTAPEFDAAVGRALTNDAGSGLRDLFEVVRPIVRPQEMMVTPQHIKLYRRHGIEAISLFYSAVVFNAFSNFIPPLPLAERYNPLTLTYPGIDETITLLPTYNHGDIADHLSLRRWVRQVRRQQLEMDEPRDLLILIDADADDEYWVGYDWPLVRRLLTAAQGLHGLVNSVADLEYLTFTTPHDYLAGHEPVAEVCIGQDTGDGSFDGYTSWAEKWSNHALWTGIERSRILCQQSRALGGTDADDEMLGHLNAAFEARLRALSTTHFGLACPVMNQSRLNAATALVATAITESQAAFRLALAGTRLPPIGAGDLASFSLSDYARGRSTESVTYRLKSSAALVRLPLQDVPPGSELALTDGDGHGVPSVVRAGLGAPNGHSELCFVADMAGGQQRGYRLTRGHSHAPPPVTDGVVWQPQRSELANALVKVRFDGAGNPTRLAREGVALEGAPLIDTAVRYGRDLLRVTDWQLVSAEVLGDGLVGAVTTRGTIPIPSATEPVTVRREYLVAMGLPYLHVTTDIAYPATPAHTRDRALVQRLERDFDDRWQEVLPCEIRPGLVDAPGLYLRVWKHNYLDHVSHFDLDYGTFSDNDDIDAFNNAITHGWVAVSDQTRGLLVAQSADAATCFAFCPMRTRQTGDHTQVILNPFGTYFGRQMAYPTADTGLGKRVAVLMSDTLRSMAPSYGGRHERFSLLLAPYQGDAPPAQLQADAEAFASPYAVVSTSDAVLAPSHRAWSAGDLVDWQTITH